MLHWTIESRTTGEIVVAFEGEITAHVSFETLSLRGRRVILDLAGVRRLNSQGVHQLLEFLQRVAESAPVEVERCSPAVILQLGMLPTMAALVSVRSLFVPLECARCSHEGDVLLEVPPSGRRPAVPETSCPECGAAMVLAEPPERYFAWLRE